MTEKVDTGYEDRSKDPPPTDSLKWRSRRMEHFSSANIVLQILKNNVGVGLLRLDNEEEVVFIQKLFPQAED